MHQFQTDLLREILTPYILVLSTSLNVQNRKDRKFSFAFSHGHPQRINNRTMCVK